MSMIVDLQGKVAMVTGASAGLGRHFAQVLARSGATVVLAARRMGPLHDLAAQIEAEGGAAPDVAFQFDAAVVRAHDALHDHEPEAGAFFLGGIISFKNTDDFFGRNAGTVIGNRNFHGQIAVAARSHKNVSPIAQRVPRILQKVDENFREMSMLHEQRWKRRRISPVDNNLRRYRNRKNLDDGAVKLFDDV